MSRSLSIKAGRAPTYVTALADRGDLWESAKGRSDEQGRWRCDGIQQDLKEVKIKVKHSDFVSELENDFASNLPMEDLRAMKGVIVMKRGIAVAGLVMDEAGKAIGGASVRAGAAYSDSSVKVMTDGEGRFLLKNSRPGSMTLTATARGYAPDVRAVKVRVGIKPTLHTHLDSIDSDAARH